MLKGACVCGAVSFEVKDAFVYAGYCHCSLCRRRTGSAFSAFAGIEAEHVRLTSGSGAIVKRGEGEDHDVLCGRCWSPLYSLVRQRTFVHVRLGSLSDAPSKHPDHHIYVGSKAPWHTITDALPQYDELPPV